MQITSSNTQSNGAAEPYGGSFAELSSLPSAVLAAHVSRGELQRAGAGLLPTSNHHHFLERLLCLDRQLPPNTVVCRQTAAWVWGAVNQLPEPLQINTAPGCSRVSGWYTKWQQHSPALQLHYSRYRAQELVVFRGRLLTTRFRTVLDLLFADAHQNDSAEIARMIRTLCVKADISYETVRGRLKANPYDKRTRRALSNLDKFLFQTAASAY